MKIQWPEGKAFAFTVFDDTDLSIPGNFEKVYEFLHELGFKTTKSVWPTSGHYARPRHPQGSTCEDPEYLKKVLEIQSRGTEIGFHNSFELALERADIVKGLDEFKRLFGHFPRAMSNHGVSTEAVYWGEARLDGVPRAIYRILHGFVRKRSWGHIPGQKYFWGDLCRDRIEYVRSYTLPGLDIGSECPETPYHDPLRPYVNQWFTSTEAPNLDSFLRAISEKNQDRLERDGGVSILYTHFAAGFQKDGEVDPEFRRLMSRLAAKNGWFAPVSTVLDFIRKSRGEHVLTSAERSRLQWKWLFHKVRVGGTS